jgi:phage terminase large subunit GpA-like protein
MASGPIGCYSFCFPRASRRVMAIKVAAGSRPSIAASHGKVKGGRLWIVGTDTVKTTLFSRLTRGSSIRFSKSLEPAYYEQLSSERRIVRYARGRPVRRFERIVGKRAEALDCLVYAFAAQSAVAVQLDQRADDLHHATPTVASPTVIPSKWMS